jgi:hypothetical protein
VEALLIFSLAYAGWRAWRMQRPDASRKASGLLGPSWLVVVGSAVAIATFIVRLWFPFDSLQFTNAHVWQWPECIGLFGLGIVSARRGWLRPVPDRIRRGCGWVAMFATAALILAFAATRDADRSVVAFGGGWRWEALALAAITGAMSVAASIWVLALVQRRRDRAGRTARAMSRSAYAAFMLQGIPLILFALALRTFDVPLEIKALVVAVGGIAGSFGLGWLLVSRTRLGRIV